MRVNFGSDKIPPKKPSLDTNQVAKKYASEQGISLDAAKESLRKKYGNPVVPKEGQTPKYLPK